MNKELLKILVCPKCRSTFEISDVGLYREEIDKAELKCSSNHTYEIRNGIVYMMSHKNNEIVQEELKYEEETYQGNEKLFDFDIIKRYPDSLVELWPHTKHFGYDFKGLIDFINPPEGSMIADLGCGSSWTTRLLAERMVNAVAVDINDSEFCGLGVARHYHEENKVYYDRVLESMTVLPFKDSSFDFITFNASFHHSPDISLTLSECKRALKDDGKIVMINESFIGLRHKITGVPENNEGGSHRDVPWKELFHALRRNRLIVEFYLAPHIETKINSNSILKLIKPVFAHPVAIRLMNSAMLVITKQK